MRLAAARTALAAVPARLRAPLRLWPSLARERRALADLDDRALRDVGLDRRAAEREAARPFWDAPAARR